MRRQGLRQLPHVQDAAVAQRPARPEDAVQRVRGSVQAGEAPAAGWVAPGARPATRAASQATRAARLQRASGEAKQGW